jgi:surface protein
VNSLRSLEVCGVYKTKKQEKERQRIGFMKLSPRFLCVTLAVASTIPHFAIAANPVRTNVDLRDAVFEWVVDNANAIVLYGPISDWDTSGVTVMAGAFQFASSLNEDLSQWDVSGVTSMREMFAGAQAFQGDLSAWDVSNVIDMSSMFSGATSFFGDLSGWNVSSVTEARAMFNDARAFNSTLASWDVGALTDMSFMFSGTAVFNSDISGWDVSSVEDMEGMFVSATSFDQDLTPWCTAKILSAPPNFCDQCTPPIWGCGTNSPTSSPTIPFLTDGLIQGAVDDWCAGNVPPSIYGPIQDWDTSRVTTMASLFLNKVACNPDISQWDVSNVKDMSAMFLLALSFSGDLSAWNVSSVTTTSAMFLSAVAFNSNLGSWDVSGLTDMSLTFSSATSFVGDGLESWDVSSVVSMNEAFMDATAFSNAGISAWNVSSVTDVSAMFNRAVAFDSNLVSWDVSGLTDMSFMFYGATAFVGSGLESWDVSSVVSMDGTFKDATAFSNTGISAWNVSGVNNMDEMFKRTSPAFLSNLNLAGAWCVPLVPSQPSYFCDSLCEEPIWGCPTESPTASPTPLPPLDNAIIKTEVSNWCDGLASPYGNIATWDTSGVTDMSELFFDMSPSCDPGVSNPDLSQWVTSNVITMRGMFKEASQYDWDLSGWNTGQVTDMSDMFRGSAGVFGGVSGLDTSKVLDMSGMFRGTNFNGDLVNWDTSEVSSMNGMFYQATQFYGDGLQAWDVLKVSNMDNMFDLASNFFGDLSSWCSPLITVAPANFCQSCVAPMWGCIGPTSAPTQAPTVPPTTAFQATCGRGFGGMLYFPDGGNPSVNNPTTEGLSCPSGYSSPRQLVVPADRGGGSLIVCLDANSDESDGPNYFGSLRGDNECVGFDYVAYELSTNMYLCMAAAGSGADRSCVTDMWHVTSTDAALYQSTCENGGGVFDFEEIVDFVTCRQPEPVLTDTNVQGAVDDWCAGNSPPSIYGPIETWNTSQVTTMASLFLNKVACNPDISQWDVSGVTDMSGMFFGASSFSQSLGGWDVSAVTVMDGMFQDASSFRGEGISAWNISRVATTSRMFSGSTFLEVDLSAWDLSEVRNASYMFASTFAFSGAGVAGWDVSRLEDASGMFYNAKNIQGVDLSEWDVSSVAGMDSMFAGATLFSADLSLWQVSNVTSMESMFESAASFTTNLLRWCVPGIAEAPANFCDACAEPVWGECPCEEEIAEPPAFSNFRGNLTSKSVPGIYNATFAGCPDTDGDSVPDVAEFDGCVSSSSSSEFLSFPAYEMLTGSRFYMFAGCQDEDGDLVPDVAEFEGCEGVGGEFAFERFANLTGDPAYLYSGCVDADQDSVPDILEESECVSAETITLSIFLTYTSLISPENPLKYVGCPDVDEDGVPDLVEYEGCVEVGETDFETFLDYVALVGEGNLARYIGCKDKDGDSVPDILEPEGCVEDVGQGTLTTFFAFESIVSAAMFNYTGCPDVDEDLVPDVREIDQCRNVSGLIDQIDGSASPRMFFGYEASVGEDLAKYAGCPDTNGDGEPDLRICPDGNATVSFLLYEILIETGENVYFGCADADGDSIPDVAEYEGCDNQTATITFFDYENFVGKSPYTFYGCADTDSDGVPDAAEYKGCDTQDATITFFDHENLVGQPFYTFYGCADSDNDGVPDVVDDTPFTALTDATIGGAVDDWCAGNAPPSIYGPIEVWDTSQVTNMASLFLSKATCNPDVSQWDVSGVTTMASMFENAASFNQDLGSWDVSGVTTMHSMFGTTGSSSFEGIGLANWDVSSVTGMNQMFEYVSVADLDLSTWCVESVGFFFAFGCQDCLARPVFGAPCVARNLVRTDADLDDAVSEWETGNRDNAYRLYGPISDWNTSQVTDMSLLFAGMTTFNDDISSWDTSGVTTMAGMFEDVNDFDQDLGSWDVSSVTTMDSMFRNSGTSTIADSKFTGTGLANWEVSSVTSMNRMFYFQGNTLFQEDLSSWDVSQVTDMDVMFFGATAAVMDLSAWCVEKIPSTPNSFGCLNCIAPIWGQVAASCPTSSPTSSPTMALDLCLPNEMISTLNLTVPAEGGPPLGETLALDVTVTGHFLYIADFDNGRVLRAHVTDGTVVQVGDSIDDPTDVQVSVDQQTVFVATLTGLFALDISEGSYSPIVDGTAFAFVTQDPAQPNVLYASAFFESSSFVVVVDLVEGEVSSVVAVADLSIGEGSFAGLAAGDSGIYASSPDDNLILFFNLTDPDDVTTTEVASGLPSPTDLAFFPGTRTLLVTNPDDATLSEVDVDTGIVTTVLGQSGMFGLTDGTWADARFDTPHGVAFSQQTSNFFVGDAGSVRHVCLETLAPTASPTTSPTSSPTDSPSLSPTTKSPTAIPTATPTASPSATPTAAPTQQPTASPSATPTATPTQEPTSSPTATPTPAPTASPTTSPTTKEPTASPTTGSPTMALDLCLPNEMVSTFLDDPSLGNTLALDVTATGHFIYIADLDNDRVLRAHATNGDVVTVASGLTAPADVQVSVDQLSVFVATASGVQVLDIASPGSTSPLASAGTQPVVFVTQSPDDESVLYASTDVGTVLELDVIGSASIELVSAGALVEPHGLAYGNGGLYVADKGADAIVFLNLTTLALDVIATGVPDPTDLAFFPETKTLLVTSSANSTLVKVDVDTGGVTVELGVENVPGSVNGPWAVATFDRPHGVAFSQQTSNFFVGTSGSVRHVCLETLAPTRSPTRSPTVHPTASPSLSPTTKDPTRSPTATPTAAPTQEPTASPSAAPTATPTAAPTQEPTASPSATPTVTPTQEPTASPSSAPTKEPTASPSAAPTASPSATPTATPTQQPTVSPTTSEPTASPTTGSPTMALDLCLPNEMVSTFLADMSLGTTLALDVTVTGHFVYIADRDNGRVLRAHATDAANFEVVASGLAAPADVQVSVDQRFVFVATASGVQVLDIASESVSPLASAGMQSVVFVTQARDGDGSVLYASTASGAVLELDVVGSGSQVLAGPGPGEPHGLASGDGGLYVAFKGEGTVKFLDLGNANAVSLVAALDISDDPTDLAFFPNTRTLLVTSPSNSALFEVDVDTGAVATALGQVGVPGSTGGTWASATFDDPHGVAFSLPTSNFFVGTNGSVRHVCLETLAPTASPTFSPTTSPTESPSLSPTTKEPTASPSATPTAAPTREPTASPSAAPTDSPTASPTSSPSASPSRAPTAAPTATPTAAPTEEPTASPSAAPTVAPTSSPSDAPTKTPTASPTTREPTASPTTGSPTMALDLCLPNEMVSTFLSDPLFLGTTLALDVTVTGHFVYIADRDNGRVLRAHATDAANFDVVASGLDAPADVQVSVDQRSVYVATASGVQVLDIASESTSPLASAGTQSIVFVTQDRYGDGSALYASTTSGAVLELDVVGTGSQVLTSVGLVEPHGLAFGDNGLYVADRAVDEVMFLGLGTGTVTPVAAGIPGPTDLAFFPTTQTLLVTSPGDHTLWKVDLGTLDVTLALGQSGVSGSMNGTWAEATFAGPHGVAFSQQTSNFFVGTSGSVRHVCLETLAPTTSPSLSPTTKDPTRSPTTAEPTASPTATPTTADPTASPTATPTTAEPTAIPTAAPTTADPTASPTATPTTAEPTASPTAAPTTAMPTAGPTATPTTATPTAVPTATPTATPTEAPTTGSPTVVLDLCLPSQLVTTFLSPSFLVDGLPLGASLGLDVSESGHFLYVADTDNDRVLRANVAGILSAETLFSEPGLAPADVQLSADQTRLFVAAASGLLEIRLATGAVSPVAGAGGSPFAYVTASETALYASAPGVGVLRFPLGVQGPVETLLGGAPVGGLALHGGSLYVAAGSQVVHLDLVTLAETEVVNVATADFADLAFFPGSETLLVTDSTGHVVRKVDLVNGLVTTALGVEGESGTADGSWAEATLAAPRGVAFSSQTSNFFVGTAGSVRHVCLETLPPTRNPTQVPTRAPTQAPTAVAPTTCITRHPRHRDDSPDSHADSHDSHESADDDDEYHYCTPQEEQEIKCKVKFRRAFGWFEEQSGVEDLKDICVSEGLTLFRPYGEKGQGRSKKLFAQELAEFLLKATCTSQCQSAIVEALAPCTSIKFVGWGKPLDFLEIVATWQNACFPVP